MHDEGHEDDAGGAAEEIDPRPDRELRRRLQLLHARPLDMGSARELLQPLYGGWYRECVECGAPVGADDEPYYVERALRGSEPLFEYALCQPCVFAFQDDLSIESIRRIGRFWLEVQDLDDRLERLRSATDGASLMEVCLLSGRPRRELEEFQVWAWVRSGRLDVDEHAPGVVSGAVLDEVVELLSRRTRERLDDFVRDRLGLPPELHNLPILV